MSEMKTHLIVCDVSSASGWQQYKVQATDEEDALKRFAAGEADFDCEEIEVSGLSDPYCAGVEDSHGLGIQKILDDAGEVAKPDNCFDVLTGKRFAEEPEGG